jgi:hypothetical protein
VRAVASSTLIVRYAPCHLHGPVDDVSLITDPTGTIPASGKMRRRRSGAEVYVASVRPGYYSVVAGVLPCSDSRNVALLPGKNRSIDLRGHDELIMGAALAALEGTLPAGNVRLVADCLGLDKQTVRYVAAVQSGAYYFDSIRGPAKCNVRAFALDGRGVPLVSFWENAEPFKAVRRDISW